MLSLKVEHRHDDFPSQAAESYMPYDYMVCTDYWFPVAFMKAIHTDWRSFSMERMCVLGVGGMYD